MRYFLSSIILGFSTSSICAITCLPLYLPFSVSREERGRYFQVLSLFIGRFVSYSIVGALSGALGSAVSEHFIRSVSSYAIFILAALLFFRAAGIFRKEARACSFLFSITEKIRSPMLVGFLTGLNLCYPFLIAIAHAASLRSVFGGVVVFSGFFIGTSTSLLPLFLVPLLRRPQIKEWIVKFASVMACLLALVYMAKALQVIFPQKELKPDVSSEAIQDLFPSSESVKYTTVSNLPCYIAYDSQGEIAGYAVLSTDITRDIMGYGGPIPVLLAFDGEGNILNLKVLPNKETPAYVFYIFSEDFLRSFRGKSARDTFEIGIDVDAVSGATVSLTSLVKTIKTTAQAFSTQVLSLEQEYAALSTGKILDAGNVSVILLFLLSIVVLRYFIRFRTVFLIVSFIVLGLIFHFFISITDVIKITFGMLDNPAEYPYRYLILALAFITTILFGRHYCSFICPYGALQELLYYISPLKRSVSEHLDRQLRRTKYGILFLLPILFAFTGNFIVLNFEPFGITFQSVTSLRFLAELLKYSMVTFLFILVLAGASMVLERFFCLYLCPLGALFAILSTVKIFSRRLFMRKGASCEGCVKGIPDFEAECFICGGLISNNEKKKS